MTSSKASAKPPTALPRPASLCLWQPAHHREPRSSHQVPLSLGPDLCLEPLPGPALPTLHPLNGSQQAAEAATHRQSRTDSPWHPPCLQTQLETLRLPRPCRAPSVCFLLKPIQLPTHKTSGTFQTAARTCPLAELSPSAWGPVRDVRGRATVTPTLEPQGPAHVLIGASQRQKELFRDEFWPELYHSDKTNPAFEKTETCYQNPSQARQFRPRLELFKALEWLIYTTWKSVFQS